MKKITILSLAVILAANTTDSQNFHNLTFNNWCDSSQTGLCYWDLSWGDKGAVTAARMGKISCMLIQSAVENSVGFSEQSSAFPVPADVEFITLTADIKTEAVTGKGAGLNLWLLDEKGMTITAGKYRIRLH